MQITLLQGIVISIIVFFLAIDWLLEAFFLFRPIIVCSLVGLVLGDLQLGLQCGAITELAFAGLTAVGGTVPPDPIIAGVMCIVLAFTTKASPATALALSIPFAVLMQVLNNIQYTLCSFGNSKANQYANEGNTSGIIKIAILFTIIHSVIYFIVTICSTYLAQDATRTLIEKMPEWLIHGFEVAGGLIPAIGFAMLLNVMLKTRFLAYLLTGFLLVCFIPMNNILPVAIIGLSFALIDYYTSNKEGDVHNDQGI